MNRWILRSLLALTVAGCGDGDVLPAQRDDATRDNARAEPDQVASDDQSHESDVQDHSDSDQPGKNDNGSAPPRDSGADKPDAHSDLDAQDAHAPAREDAAALVSGDSAADGGNAPVDGGGMDAGDSAQAHDAGSGDAQLPDAGNSLTYWRDAKPIIDAKCKPCHFEGGIGPFPLTTYSEVKQYRFLIHSDVEGGVMPPWRASGPLDVFVGDRRLSEPQKSTLLRWIDEGALEGNPADAPPTVPPDRRGLDRVDLSLPIGGPYTPEVTPDDYRCFVLEWPYTTTKYVTGISIEPDRTASVHHAILYLEPPENAASVRSQDRADSGPGFSCFSNIASITTWLTSYEPGGYGQTFPGGLGFEVRAGSLMVLQVHYNARNGRGPDSSRVDFQVADRVDRVGTVQQLIEPLWVLGFMEIRANAADTVHRWRGRPSGLSSFTTYDLHWVDLHMHTLGSRGSVSIVRSGRTLEPLLQIPDWDFNWQQTYILRQPVKLNPGDELEVECHFDNTAGNQMIVDGRRLTPRTVNWGEATTDEMCLGNVLATPAR